VDQLLARGSLTGAEVTAILQAHATQEAAQ
jgi:hypothetical protein